jgi:hypothetical protein
MRRRKIKIIFGALFIAIPLALSVGYLIKRSNQHILDWGVTDVSERFQYWINGRMEPNCLEAEICVTNLTSGDVIIDWNRDESEFEINGGWVKNDTIAGRAYIAPHESITFPVSVPQKTQAIHYRLHYEDGPLWSTINDFLQDHKIYLSDSVFGIIMKYDRKMPAHWKQLDIEVNLSDLNKTNSSGGKF